MKKTWIYDLEQFPNLHTATFKDIKSDTVKTFVLHKSKNQLKEYIRFLKTECKYLIGFNNINYDYPLLHYILKNEYKLLKSNKPEKLLYLTSQEIIKSKYSSIKDKYVIIPQIDLFRINNYQNKNKSTSLKWIEFSLRWNNVQDLPYRYDDEIDEENIQLVLDYNLNDVLATEMFFNYCKPQIDLRLSLGKKYDLNLLNESDTSMGVNLMIKKYSEYTGKNPEMFKHLRDYSTHPLYLKNIISDTIQFKSIELNKVLLDLKSNLINLRTQDEIEESESFKYSFKYNQCTYDIAKGGLHSTLPPMLLHNSDDYTIIDIDFSSYYPNIMLKLKLYPPQLGEYILTLLQELTELRLKAKADKDMITSDATKITINSIFGNLGNQYSFLYSPETMYKVTINGQLILLMLIEELELNGAICFYTNTDGCTFKVPKNKVNLFYEICKNFDNKIGIPIEFNEYKLCAIRDVNNYLIITTDNKVKLKGDFEINKLPHKNNSQIVVAKAVHEYLVNKTPIDYYIYHNTNILDFCKGVKITGKNRLVSRTFDGLQFNDELLSKTTRYYVSNNGVRLIKMLPPLLKKTYTEKYNELIPNQLSIFDMGIEDVIVRKVRETNIEANNYCTVLNQFDNKKNISEYDINYEYYINECNKIISDLKL
jgi:hypothetical protein